MAPHASTREQLIHVGRVLALVAFYFALGRIGPALTPMSGFAALVWPASGAGLAALVLGGYRLWPGIAIGASMAELSLGSPPLVALGVAAGNTLEAVAGTFALRRIPGFRSSLDRFTDVLGLALLAGVASSAIGATVSTLGLALGRDQAVPIGQTWMARWTSDLIGILIVAPLVLTWTCGPRLTTRSRDIAWVAVLGALLVGSSALLFSQSPETAWIHTFRPHLLLLPLLWLSLYCGVRGAATGTFILAVAAVWGTYTGHGIYAREDLIKRLSALQLFFVTMSLGSLILGAVVSERERSRESLRESEERQRLATEAAHLGMWCWDQKNDELTWTPRCRSIHGVSQEEELTYRRFLEALHPDDRERIASAFLGVIADRTEYRNEYRAVWPDGSIHWISVLGKVFYDESRKQDRILGVAVDITTQKEAEQKRAELLERERSARADAQAANRAKDEFLAVLSHELRTPLQSMLGWTQILMARPFDDRTLHKGLETIDRNVKTQAQLIEDLLDVSRIVAGKLRLERVRVDLADVVASALDSTKAAADAKSIPIDATTESLAGEVVGDPDRLQQVVSNLLSNAVKFTPCGGRIDVRIERDGRGARIVVEDSGRGIAPEFLPHVFDRFCQAESSMSRSHGGLGLGLAIVRHLVELHGGSVKAESSGEGRGASFTVKLPLVSVERRAITIDQRKAKKRAPAAPVELRGVRILMVDDDPDACEMLKTALRESGADVRAVHSVSAALEELESFRPNLLLSDIGMPEEDGYALIRRVRERESIDGGHMPAVALTAFASQADREQALALGFEEHLAKPTSPSELARTVARLLGRTA